MIDPMLAKAATFAEMEVMLQDERWGAQQKLDGIRCMVYVESGNGKTTVRARSRGNMAVTLPKAIVDEFTKLSIDAVFDGELVGQRLHLFDLPQLSMAGQTFVQLSSTLRKRHEVLTATFGVWLPSPAIQLVPLAVGDQRHALIKAVNDGDDEGWVFKLLTSTYQPGKRGHYWCKVKRWKTLDAFVRGLDPDGRASVQLGLTDGTHVIPVGSASTRGKGLDLGLGDIVEVKYLRFSAGGQLTQPEILRQRHDKALTDCTTAQH